MLEFGSWNHWNSIDTLEVKVPYLNVLACPWPWTSKSSPAIVPRVVEHLSYCVAFSRSSRQGNVVFVCYRTMKLSLIQSTAIRFPSNPSTVNIRPFKESTQEQEPRQISRDLWIRDDKLTTAVLVGIYTCVKFFLPFHSNGVVKNLVPESILSKPP